MAIGTPATLGGNTLSANASSATHTLTTTVVADVGETIIVIVTSSTVGRTLNTVTDSVGNTYTIDKTQNDANAGNVHIVSAPVTTQLPIGGVITATWASAITSVRGLAAMKVSGLISAGRVDVTTSGTNSSSAWNGFAAGATTQADELLIAACTNDSALTSTPGTVTSGGASYTELFDFNGNSKSLYCEWAIVAATNTYRFAGTWSGTARWQAALVTYKANTIVQYTSTLSATQAQTATSPKQIGKTLVP